MKIKLDLGWVIVILSILGLAIWFRAARPNAPIIPERRFCPGCGYEFILNLDFYKTCPDCGYIFYLNKNEIKSIY